MKVLVLSDSHGQAVRLRTVLRREADCSLVFFLGDGLRELERVRPDFPERAFVCVNGNNDWNANGSYDDFAYKFIEGHTVVATHGHRCAVRYSLQDLAQKALDVRADVALYGHTHIPRQDLTRGVLCVNPGALCDGCYAVLDFSKQNIEVTFKNSIISDS